MNPSVAELKELVTDCGISHSTLEEVFMKVTGRKQPKHKSTKDQEGPSESNKSDQTKLRGKKSKKINEQI